MIFLKLAEATKERLMFAINGYEERHDKCFLYMSCRDICLIIEYCLKVVLTCNDIKPTDSHSLDKMLEQGSGIFESYSWYNYIITNKSTLIEWYNEIDGFELDMNFFNTTKTFALHMLDSIKDLVNKDK